MKANPNSYTTQTVIKTRKAKNTNNLKVANYKTWTLKLRMPV